MTPHNFNKSKKFLQQNSEEYLLKIENGEKDNYIKCLILIDKYKYKNGNLKNDYIDTLNARKDKYLKQYKYRMTGQLITQDNGSIGMSYICELAKNKNQLIYL